MKSKQFFLHEIDGTGRAFDINKESLTKAISLILTGDVRLTTETKEQCLRKIRKLLKRLRDADK